MIDIDISFVNMVSYIYIYVHYFFQKYQYTLQYTTNE